jgi:hypothetical protein
LITRSQIIETLRRWQAGELSAREVSDWAQHLFWPGSAEFDDEDMNGASVSREVLAILDQLPANLIVAEDVPAFLEFLVTPSDQFEIGSERFRSNLRSIDYEHRRQQLRTDDLYRQFCGDGGG